MIKYIEILTEKRQVGKTLNILNKFADLYEDGKEVFILTFCENEASRLRSMLDIPRQESLKRIKSVSTLLSGLRGGVDNTEIILLIDEPFLIDKEVQYKLFRELERSRTEFYVLGVGTLREGFRKDFTHYVDWRENEM